MADRLPIEIWHEVLLVLLLVDCDLEPDYEDNKMVLRSMDHHCRLPMSENWGTQPYLYIPRQVKTCVRSFRLTCRWFHEAVNRNSQMWIAKLWIVVRESTSPNISQTMAELKRKGIPADSGNSDLDIRLRFRIYEDYDSIQVQPLLELVAEYGERLRQLSISITGTEKLVEDWVKFEPKLPKLPRLKSFEFWSSGPHRRGIGAAMISPHLQNLQLDAYGKASPLPIITPSFMTHIKTLLIIGQFEAFTPEEFNKWSEMLLETLPFLRKLRFSIEYPRLREAYHTPNRISKRPGPCAKLSELSIKGYWDFIQEALVDLLPESTSLRSLQLLLLSYGENDIQTWGSTTVFQASRLMRLWLGGATWLQFFSLFEHASFPSLEIMHAGLWNGSNFILPRRIRLPNLRLLHVEEQLYHGTICLSSLLGMIDAPSLKMLRLSKHSEGRNLRKFGTRVVFPALETIQIQINRCSQRSIDQVFRVFKDWDIPSIKAFEVFMFRKDHDESYSDPPSWRQALKYIQGWSGSLRELTVHLELKAESFAIIVDSFPALRRLTILPLNFEVLALLSCRVDGDEVPCPIPALRHLVLDMDKLRNPAGFKFDGNLEQWRDSQVSAVIEVLRQRKAAGYQVEHIVLVSCAPSDSRLDEIHMLVGRAEVLKGRFLGIGLELNPFLELNCCL